MRTSVRRLPMGGERWFGAAALGLLLGLLGVYGDLLLRGVVKAGESGLLVYYAAGKLILTGAAGHLYDPAALQPIERALLAPVPLDGVSPFLYPPFVALALAPLAALSYPAAYILWSVLALSVLAVTLRSLHRYGHVSRQLWWAGGASFLPVFMTLAVGQVSLLILAALTIAFFAVRNGRDEVAGAALALALIKPPYVLPFLLVLAVRGRVRALAAFAVSGALLALLPLPVLGWRADTAYLHLLLAGTHWQSAGFSAAWNLNLLGFTRLLFPAGVPLIAGALDLAALAAVVETARRPVAIDLPLALAVVVGLLVSPHTLIHDLALLLLPAAVIFRYRRTAPTTVGALLAGGYFAVLVGAPLVTILPIQLAVPAMVAGAGWLYLAARVAGSEAGSPIVGGPPCTSEQPALSPSSSSLLPVAVPMSAPQPQIPHPAQPAPRDTQ